MYLNSHICIFKISCERVELNLYHRAVVGFCLHRISHMSFVNAGQILDMQFNAFGVAYSSVINSLEHDKIKREIRTEVIQYNELVNKYNELHYRATNTVSILRHENMLLEIENAQLKKKLGIPR